MKKYKVIALSVGGLGNKIFESGDVVLENNFVPGRADELVGLGFLKVLEEESEIQSIMADPIISIDDISYTELKEKLKAKGISFRVNASKQELYDLWIK